MFEKPLPRLDAVGAAPDPPSAVVLVLHGGSAHSRSRGDLAPLAFGRMLPFGRRIAEAAPQVAVRMLRYRVRGWNAPVCDALVDARWALAEIGARLPGVPVVLVGHSMGGRAALGAAGAENVVGVCALAPWLEDHDPVEHLAGRTVLIVHADREHYTDPRASFGYAVRAKQVTERVARFELPGAGHFMLRRAQDWDDLVRHFVLGVLGIDPMDPGIADALRLPSPEGLRAALV